MKTALTLLLASFCFTTWSAEKGALVKDRSFDFVERVEAVWNQPDLEDWRIRIFAIRVASEAANPIGLFVHAVTGAGPESRSSLWDTGIRCMDVSDMKFGEKQVVICVLKDVFQEDTKPMPAKRVGYQISGLHPAKLCAEKPHAPVVNTTNES